MFGLIFIFIGCSCHLWLVGKVKTGESITYLIELMTIQIKDLVSLCFRTTNRTIPFHPRFPDNECWMVLLR